MALLAACLPLSPCPCILLHPQPLQLSPVSGFSAPSVRSLCVSEGGKVEEVLWEDCHFVLHSRLHKQRNFKENLSELHTRSCVFTVSCSDTQTDEHLRVVGNVPQLGMWKAEGGLRMSSDSAVFPLWKSDRIVELPTDQDIYYKYIKHSDSAKKSLEESAPDTRHILLPAVTPSVFSSFIEPSCSTLSQHLIACIQDDAFNTTTTTPYTTNTTTSPLPAGGMFVFGESLTATDDSKPDWSIENRLGGNNTSDNNRSAKNGCDKNGCDKNGCDKNGCGNNIYSIGPIMWVEAGVTENLCGDWLLLFEKSDPLTPLMEATGVSWVVKTAVAMTNRYENQVRLVGSRFIVKTIINVGGNTQITHIHADMQLTRELDGDMYKTVCGWDREQQELVTVRSHKVKGVIRQTRKCVSDEQYGKLQHSLIELTPPGHASPTIIINLWFAPANGSA